MNADLTPAAVSFGDVRSLSACVGRTLVAVAVVSLFSGCERPAATPTAECAAMSPHVDDASASAIDLPIKVENRLGDVFEARTVCLSVDGRRLGTGSAVTNGTTLRQRLPLEVHAMLSPERDHVVRLVVLYAGSGAFDQYIFQVTTEHAIGAKELRTETLTASVEEVMTDGPRTPVERRPQVKWLGPGSPAH